MSQLIKTRLDPISRIFPLGVRLLPLYWYSRSEDWMLITPDSSYFGGIQSKPTKILTFYIPLVKHSGCQGCKPVPPGRWHTALMAHGQPGWVLTLRKVRRKFRNIAQHRNSGTMELRGQACTHRLTARNISIPLQKTIRAMIIGWF